MKEIELVNGRGVALVDDADYERLLRFRWYLWTDGKKEYAYAVSQGGRKKRVWYRMHRIVLDAPEGSEVDHIDGNGLNNQKSNLRLCSHAENTRNRAGKNASSRFKGVSWNTERRMWVARVAADGKVYVLGRFHSETLAAIAYDDAAAGLHANFARLNFPGGVSDATRRQALAENAELASVRRG